MEICKFAMVQKNLLLSMGKFGHLLREAGFCGIIKLVLEDGMKDIFINKLEVGQEFISFFIVKSASLREDSNGKVYLDMTVGDKTGELSAKKWNLAPGEGDSLKSIGTGNFVKIKALVSEWQGSKQLKISKVRLANEDDGLDIKDYVKAAPLSTEFMYNYLVDMVKSMKDRDLREVATTILEENKTELMYYPAAAKNHHAEYGGLLYHLTRMVMSGDALCKIYTFLNRELVITGVILHDMEKIREIMSDENGISPGYSIEGQMLGHLVMGVREVEKLCERLNVPREKAVMLEHMVLSHHYEPDFGSPKKPMFPEAELLHYLDVLDARMYDMEEAFKVIEGGTLSDRIRSLDNRRIFKAEDDLYDSERLPALVETLEG